MGDLYQRTLDTQRYLESEGYTYITEWEMDFAKSMADNEHMSIFVKSLEFDAPLEPREAFKEANEDETIDYYDVTSLYSYINKTGKVPLGHPLIVTNNFENVS